jgi:hypothetical protein
MLNVADVAKAASDLVKDLTNIVGLIEKNIASYDRIKSRFQRKRTARRLDEILFSLVEWRGRNDITMWHIADRIEPGKTIAPRGFAPTRTRPNVWDYELNAYLDSLLKTRDLIQEFKSDIMDVDYRLYEKLDDAVSGRIDVLALLGDKANGNISTDKLRMVYASYTELVKSLDTVKRELQSAAKRKNGNQGSRRSGSKSEAASEDDTKLLAAPKKKRPRQSRKGVAVEGARRQAKPADRRG